MNMEDKMTEKIKIRTCEICSRLQDPPTRDMWRCGECGGWVCDNCINTPDSGAFDIPDTKKVPDWFCETCRVEVFNIEIL